ncbi:MAG TPA: hypothetical protein VGS04_04735, partial [Nitrososphaerales archaeon]|nr:hypothetical protein [Nitrososphaerales archaeon]
GTLLYQPGGSNYSSAVALAAGQRLHGEVDPPFGILTTPSGSEYRVLIGSTFDSSLPLAVSGQFTLTGTPTDGLYALTAFVASAAQEAISYGAEVNLTSRSVGIASANMTLGFGIGGGAPFAYLAFGTYPTFFSNVTLQGVVTNASSLARSFNIDVGWLDRVALSIDPSLPSSIGDFVLVNRTLWLPDSTPISGQVQEIITPQNVSAFVESLQGSDGTVDPNMVESAMNHLDEELLGLVSPRPGVVDYSFVLAPAALTRAELTGIVSLPVELCDVTADMPSGFNAAISSAASHVHAVVGVTWATAPTSSSGYQAESVRGLWAVSDKQAVTLQAAAIGISLSDASAALSGMGYSNSTLVTDLATLQNAALFVLVDPEIVQDPNVTAPYQSFALAVVPNDELSLQTSVGVYLTVSGVVYNTSYYLSSCGVSALPGCPLVVADTISLGEPARHTLGELGAIDSPSFVWTTGFLAGTTLKTVNSKLGGLSEIVQESPIDVGVYDLGWSTGTVGLNLPTIYLTWGTGPTFQVDHSDVEGLYLPLAGESRAAGGWYLDEFSAFAGMPGSGIDSKLSQGLQSAVGDVSSFLHLNVANGSLPVRGVLVLMDVSTNSTSEGLSAAVSGGGTGGCISVLGFSLGHCIISNLSLSSNSADYVSPNVANLSTSISGSASGRLAPTASCIWAGSVPVTCSVLEMACLPGALCSVGPYHVVNVTVYSCYEVSFLGEVFSCDSPLRSLGSEGSVSVSYTIYWDGTAVESTASFSVTI